MDQAMQQMFNEAMARAAASSPAGQGAPPFGADPVLAAQQAPPLLIQPNPADHPRWDAPAQPGQDGTSSMVQSLAKLLMGGGGMPGRRDQMPMMGGMGASGGPSGGGEG